MNNNFSYKVGGSLAEDAPSYVIRQADSDLYNELKAGNFCYIFNSRQMGKTSLQVRTIKRLQAEGIACTTIDISGRVSKDINPEQWYAGIVYTLAASFEIANPSEFIRTWWKENCELSPIQRLDVFIEKFLLEKIQSKIVIFIDEIDSILSLQFKGDDFFAWIRSCYEKRNLNSEFNRITFVLLGVATPSDLIADKVRTPFNIGCAVQLDGFQIQETFPLASGLKGIENPQAILQEVLAWTGGQPLLTQKVCDLLVTPQNLIHYHSLKAKGEITEAEWVENVVRQQIIENWESQDEPPHLRTIKDRILMSRHNTGALLGLYRKILQLGQIPASDSPEQIELRLSGLVVERQGYLRVYNRIYATIFDLNWVEKALADLRPYSEALSGWFASGCQDNSRLLRGKALEDAKKWMANKSLNQQDYQFLTASQEFEKQEIATALSLQEEESRILALANDTLTAAQHQARRQVRIGGGVLICSLIGAAIAFISATNQLQEAQEGTRLEQAGVAALRQFETKQIESLVTAVDAGQKLKKLVKDGRSIEKYPATSPVLALQTILDDIHETKQFVAHQDDITTVNWSHDGQYIITASNDKTARVWNLSGKLITDLRGHQEGVFIASFNPDDKHILTASNGLDRTVRIWDFSGKQLAILKHQEDVTDASFSPDGKRVITTSLKPPTATIINGETVVSASTEKSVRVWDLSGNLLLQLKNRVNSASFSPDSKYILTASDDKTARIWDTSGKLLRTFTGHSMAVNSANWSPNGKYILTNSDDSYVWDLSGKQIARFKVDDKWATTQTGFSPDSQHIFVATPHKTYIRDLSGRLIREIKNEKVLNSDAGFSPNGKRFFTTDDTIKVWDIRDAAVKTWDLSGDLLTELTGNQRSPRWSPDGRYIVTFGQDRMVRIWDLSDRTPVTIKSKDGVMGASWSPDGKYIVTPTQESVLIWDSYGKQLARFQGHSDLVSSANFSPDGKLIVTASSDKTARVWNTSGEQLLLLPEHENGIEYAAFSPNGKYILTTTYGDSNSKTRIWSKSGKLLTTFKARGINWSPNSKYIMATFDYDGKNYSSLWSISGEKIVDFKGSKNSYLGASFSRDGEHIVTTDGDTLSIWNTSGQKISEFKANQEIYSPSFSPDGKLIITTSPDNRVIIWDTSGRQLVEIPHQDMVALAKFSPDGKRIVTTSGDKVFRIWDISGKLLAQFKHSSVFTSPVNFSPDGKYILAQIAGQFSHNNEVLIWPVDELDGLLARGCHWLKDYLDTQPQVRERLKVCRAGSL
ncbi:eIF2A-related protein [Leptolyngbya sp. FACHB-261]|uniref:eIF2A-related protein n=1 Tax=Leptolyngbya sp. FACHB-261 TaxID=2692806 RepID=UPI00168698C0|nr:AAA-like domain-containing protein [Leptolyngbya sp. FACHB-261]MBD2102582.1 AAA-like domain-containing protein [Leptolyngbya sp. FACHB-261]